MPSRNGAASSRLQRVLGLSQGLPYRIRTLLPSRRVRLTRRARSGRIGARWMIAADERRVAGGAWTLRARLRVAAAGARRHHRDGRRGGRRACRPRGQAACRRSLGGPPGLGEDAAVGRAHDRQPQISGEGSQRRLRAPPRGSWRARSRFARLALLARVRPGREDAAPRSLPPDSPGGPARRVPAAAAGRRAGLGSHDSGARRPGAVVGAGHGARLPREHVRLSHRGSGPEDHR